MHHFTFLNLLDELRQEKELLVLFHWLTDKPQIDAALLLNTKHGKLPSRYAKL